MLLLSFKAASLAQPNSSCRKRQQKALHNFEDLYKQFI
jgi:hypothetical protein